MSPGPVPRRGVPEPGWGPAQEAGLVAVVGESGDLEGCGKGAELSGRVYHVRRRGVRSGEVLDRLMVLVIGRDRVGCSNSRAKGGY